VATAGLVKVNSVTQFSTLFQCFVVVLQPRVSRLLRRAWHEHIDAAQHIVSVRWTQRATMTRGFMTVVFYTHHAMVNFLSKIHHINLTSPVVSTFCLHASHRYEYLWCQCTPAVPRLRIAQFFTDHSVVHWRCSTHLAVWSALLSCASCVSLTVTDSDVIISTVTLFMFYECSRNYYYWHNYWRLSRLRAQNWCTTQCWIFVLF